MCRLLVRGHHRRVLPQRHHPGRRQLQRAARLLRVSSLVRAAMKWTIADASPLVTVLPILRNTLPALLTLLLPVILITFTSSSPSPSPRSKYPEYQPNDFYITGESYAGIYVPTLAKAVTLGNAGGASITINLKGIAVGNGCVGMAYGQCSFDYGVEINNNVPYFRGHGLIAGSLYNAFQKACPVGTDPVNPSTACQDAITEAHNEVGNVNIYDIYGDCITGPSSSATRIDAATGLEVYKRAPVPKRLGGPNECIDETIATYIGSAAVAAALHVPSTLNWAVCGSNAR